MSYLFVFPSEQIFTIHNVHRCSKNEKKSKQRLILRDLIFWYMSTTLITSVLQLWQYFIFK